MHNQVMSEQPAWASWNEDAAEHPWTVGIEEEVMLVHARSWAACGTG